MADSDVTRRKMLQLTGGSMAIAGTYSGSAGADEPRDISGDALEKQKLSGGGALWTDHLYTPSRAAEVVVWKDEEEGRYFADGQDGAVAYGRDFAGVLQNTFDENPSKVVIQAGTYELDDAVEVPSDTIVAGMGTQTKIIVNGYRGFWVKGQKGNSTGVNGVAEKGDETVDVDNGSAFEAGGYALINSDRTTNYRSQPYGEIQQLTDANSGELRVLEGGLYDFYRERDGARAYPIDMTENVRFEDLHLVGGRDDIYSAGIDIHYANRITVENCTIHGTTHSGVRISSSTNCRVEGSEMYDVHFPNAGIGYGVTVLNASRNITVTDNVFSDCKNHNTAVGGSQDGLPRMLTFSNNEYYRNDADVHFGDKVMFKNNRFVNANGGVFSGAKTTWVESCHFENIQYQAIRDRGEPEEMHVTNCTFDNIGERGLDYFDGPTSLRRLIVRNNQFRNIGGHAVRYGIQNGSVAEVFDFSNNQVDGCGSTAVHAEEDGSGRMEHVIYNGNVIENTDGYGLSTDWIEGSVEITNNLVKNVDGAYAMVVRGARNRISNNTVRGYAKRGILVNNPSHVVNNAFVDGDWDGILIKDTDGVCAAFNSFLNTGGSDIQLMNSQDGQLVFNNIATKISGDDETTLVENNHGHN